MTSGTTWGDGGWGCAFRGAGLGTGGFGVGVFGGADNNGADRTSIFTVFQRPVLWRSFVALPTAVTTTRRCVRSGSRSPPPHGHFVGVHVADVIAVGEDQPQAPARETRTACYRVPADFLLLYAAVRCALADAGRTTADDVVRRLVGVTLGPPLVGDGHIVAPLLGDVRQFMREQAPSLGRLGRELAFRRKQYPRRP